MTRRIRLAVMVVLFMLSRGLTANAQDLRIASARTTLEASGGVATGGATLVPPKKFVWLVVIVEVSPAASLPRDLDAFKVSAADSAGQIYPGVGLAATGKISDVIDILLRPVGKEGDVMTFAQWNGDDSDFSLSGRSATLRIKKAPFAVSFFFLVPAKVGAYRISGLPTGDLATGEVPLPTKKGK